jgi:peptide/nickel transport system permease protein
VGVALRVAGGAHHTAVTGRWRVGYRLGHACAVIATTLILSFALLHAAPGDALAADTGQGGRSAAARAELRRQRGLDQPMAVQLAHYLGRIGRGDLGRSYTDQRSVRDAVMEALARTLVLTGTGLLGAIACGLLVGILQGWRSDWWLSRALGAALTAIYALPEFVLALLLLTVLAYGTGWFPMGGMYTPLVAVTGTSMERLLDTGHHLVVPAVTLALGWGAAVSRQQRVALLETVGADFMRTAVAKGVSPFRLLLRHGLRPSLPAVAAVIGLMLPVLAGGAVVVEMVFGWPGMGSLLVRATAARDVPMVGGAIVVITTAVTLSSLAIDLAVHRLDPRQREHAR